MDIDSGTLRALLALAEERHFGRAAARLGITQQAMSKRIARLEERLGSAVVDRTSRAAGADLAGHPAPRGVRLTEYGQRMLVPARLVVDAVDALPVADAHLARLRIDVLDEHLLPMSRLIHAARVAALAVEPVSRPEHATAEHLLQTGGADAAFGRAGAVGTPWPAGIERRLVILEPLSVLLPAGHPWADRVSISLAALRGEELWFPMAGAPVEWREYVAELARFAGIRIDTAGATFGYQHWGAAVADGLAAPSLIGEEMPPPIGVPLVAVPIVDPTPVFPWSLLWRRDLAADLLGHLLGALDATAEPRVGRDVWMPDSDARLLR